MTKRVGTLALADAVRRLGAMHTNRIKVTALYQFLVAAQLRADSGAGSTTMSNTESTHVCDRWFRVEGEEGYPHYLMIGPRSGWQKLTSNGGWPVNTFWATLFDRSGGRPKVFESVERATDAAVATVRFRAGDDLIKGLTDLLTPKRGVRPEKPRLDDMTAWYYRSEALADDATVPQLMRRLLDELKLTDAEAEAVFEGDPYDPEPPGFIEDGHPTPERLVELLPPPINPAGDLAPGPAPTESEAANRAAVAEVVLDDRLWRVIRTAIRTFQAVMLVGSPGTGKGRILAKLATDVANNPEAFGFTTSAHGSGWPNPVVKTPHADWTAFDLVGGFVGEPDGMRWRSGFMLDAIHDDRWVVLDEANRADMDKIMGPLITWLSAQPSELGTTSKGADRRRIVLAWTDDPECLTEPEDGVDSQDDPSDKADVRYSAGQDWRLLGSYNPLDATRVFTIGYALSRRIKMIPIPPLTVPQFRMLLNSRYPRLHPQIARAIEVLYSAHRSEEETRLGPALFLDIAQYVSGASTASQGANADSETTGSGEASPAPAPAPAAEQEPPTPSESGERGDESFREEAIGPDGLDGIRPDISAPIAEGYLVSLGRYLSTLESTALASLRDRSREAISDADWEWVEQGLQSLA